MEKYNQKCNDLSNDINELHNEEKKALLKFVIRAFGEKVLDE